jgi:hypothetical protein
VRPVWVIANRWKSDYSPERREYIDEIARVPKETKVSYPRRDARLTFANAGSEESLSQSRSLNASEPS